MGRSHPHLDLSMMTCLVAEIVNDRTLTRVLSNCGKCQTSGGLISHRSVEGKLLASVRSKWHIVFGALTNQGDAPLLLLARLAYSSRWTERPCALIGDKARGGWSPDPEVEEFYQCSGSG